VTLLSLVLSPPPHMSPQVGIVLKIGYCLLTDTMVGAVVLVCIPAREFERVLHSTDTGSKIAGTGEKVEANEEILALSKHIEQYLDVLMFFTQETDEVSAGAVRGGRSQESPFSNVPHSFFLISVQKKKESNDAR
jgi:hypothetical protein